MQGVRGIMDWFQKLYMRSMRGIRAVCEGHAGLSVASCVSMRVGLGLHMTRAHMARVGQGRLG